MARGEFLRDFSEGIFGRLRELRQEQETKDFEQKKQTLSLLSSLADKVEPDSLPILMGEIGNVIGMKGDLRKFWDSFSGMPDLSLSQKLGGFLKDATGKLTGSEEASRARSTNLQELLKPYQAAGTRPRQVSDLPPPASLQGKMIFRDPRKEKLTEIEERYGLQAQAAEERQYLMNQFKAQQQEDRQKFTKEITDYRAELRARDEIDSRANLIAEARGFVEPTDAIRREAAQQLAKEQRWSNDLLQARTGFLRSRSKESEANVKFMEGSGGLTPIQQITVEDRRREAARSLKAAYDKAMSSRAEAKKRMDDIAAGITADLQKAGKGARFDPATGSVIGAKGDPKSGALRFMYEDELEAYKKAASELAGAETEAKGYWGNLRTFPYNKYYQPGRAFDEPVQEKDIGAAPAPTPPGGSGGGAVELQPKQIKPSRRSIGAIRIPQREGVSYNKGQWVSYGGKRYVVTDIEADGTAVAMPWTKGMK